MDYDDNNDDDDDDFMKFVRDIFPLNMFLNVTGFGASTVAHVYMRGVTSWLILYCPTCYM